MALIKTVEDLVDHLGAALDIADERTENVVGISGRNEGKLIVTSYSGSDSVEYEVTIKKVEKPMNSIMIAYRPGPAHQHYKHIDYGASQGWQVEMVGPLRGDIANGQYTRPQALREIGYEVIVTELPNWSDERYGHMEYQPVPLDATDGE